MKNPSLSQRNLWPGQAHEAVQIEASVRWKSMVKGCVDIDIACIFRDVLTQAVEEFIRHLDLYASSKGRLNYARTRSSSILRLGTAETDSQLLPQILSRKARSIPFLVIVDQTQRFTAAAPSHFVPSHRVHSAHGANGRQKPPVNAACVKDMGVWHGGDVLCVAGIPSSQIEQAFVRCCCLSPAQEARQNRLTAASSASQPAYVLTGCGDGGCSVPGVRGKLLLQELSEHELECDLQHEGLASSQSDENCDSVFVHRGDPGGLRGATGPGSQQYCFGMHRRGQQKKKSLSDCRWHCCP